ncbi:MAG: CCA tRNA nucleotidyltransferase [Epulopiscium sp.]|nr:CCA tRNA nucleotidyltransferase [Candidatus Epulonipiscium sp.]
MKQPMLPKDVFLIINQLNEAGHEAYIVGGCVRDCILGREPKDWDITTSAEPEEVKGIFSHTFDTGIQHGTVTVVLHKTNYEVTTYRVDGDYEDCRHPKEVSFTKSLKEDLLRRDFTMNAIAYHPSLGFQDFFHGMEDIEKKCIRGVGDAAKRFQEDALRMLRALRFSVQLGFTVEEATYSALVEHKALIGNISAERIHEELHKLLMGNYIQNMRLLWESELLGEISMPLQKTMEGYGESIITQLQGAPFDGEIRWGLLLQHWKASAVKELLKYLKFDTNTLRRVVGLVEMLPMALPRNEYEIRKAMGKFGAEMLCKHLEMKALLGDKEALKIIEKVQELLERGDCYCLKQLNFCGEDVMALGVPKGPKIGEILGYLLDVVQQNPSANEKALLLSYAREYCEKE